MASVEAASSDLQGGFQAFCVQVIRNLVEFSASACQAGLRRSTRITHDVYKSFALACVGVAVPSAGMGPWLPMDTRAGCGVSGFQGLLDMAYGPLVH